MKKSLIIELNRMNTLMGLITEAPGGLWVELGETIVKSFGKKVGKVSQLFDDSMQALKYAKTDELAISALSKLANESPEIAEIVLPKVMATIDAAEKGVIKDLENMLVKEIKAGKMTKEEAGNFIDDWVSKEVKTEFKGVQELIKLNAKKNVSEAIKVKPIRPPGKKGKEVVNIIKKVGSEWYTTLERAGLNPAEKLSVAKALPFRKLRADVQLFAENLINNRFGRQEKAIEEMFAKLKKFVDGLETNAEPNLAYIRDINVTLQSLKASEAMDVKLLREAVIESLKKAKGPNGETIDYKTISKIDSFLSENSPTDINSPSWLSDFIPTTAIGEMYKKYTKSELTLTSFGWDMVERIGMFGLTGTLKNYNSFRKYWISKGIPMGLLSLYVWSSLWSKVFIPLIFGFLVSIIQAIEANKPGGVGKDYLERLFDLVMEKLLAALVPKDEDGSLNWIKLLIPFNYYYDTIYANWNSISKGEWGWMYEEAEKKGKEIIEAGKEKIEKVKEKVKEKVGEIANTPEGFEAFCLKNGYTPDGFGGMSGRTIEINSLGTNEWYWDGKTFAPVAKP
jgi:hypothetical protein